MHFPDIHASATKAHHDAKAALSLTNPQDVESQRDHCIEQKNAVQTIINHFDDQMDELKKQKRMLDDKLADIRKLQRDWKGLKEDLEHDSKRLNNYFWELRREKASSAIKDF